MEQREKPKWDKKHVTIYLTEQQINEVDDLCHGAGMSRNKFITTGFLESLEVYKKNVLKEQKGPAI